MPRSGGRAGKAGAGGTGVVRRKGGRAARQLPPPAPPALPVPPAPPVRKTRIEGQTIYGYMARVPPERMGPGDPDDPYSTLPGGNDSESVRLINTAGILNLRGDEKGAMRCYKAILERLPDNYVANYGVGTALRLAGKPRRAIAYLERAIRVWPETAWRTPAWDLRCTTWGITGMRSGRSTGRWRCSPTTRSRSGGGKRPSRPLAPGGGGAAAAAEGAAEGAEARRGAGGRAPRPEPPAQRSGGPARICHSWQARLFRGGDGRNPWQAAHCYLSITCVIVPKCRRAPPYGLVTIGATMYSSLMRAGSMPSNSLAFLTDAIE